MENRRGCVQLVDKRQKRSEIVKWLDEIETDLIRAERARKDIDLLVTMRAVRAILEKIVREESHANQRSLSELQGEPRLPDQ